ncbi:metal-dependent transcriptional regulator [Litorilinea aerophila]|uniref:Manganese transport regulator n=1 Tax=Litorilinea aerophila TaxID=1204385 RepID=A0A540VM84_9CHLR|nr:metal-dependent transcriptional regulator [Litorilinea aerophila]MCC9074503.1 metal-dependent transcriptional regulator [Litorilinea aerophila]
MTKNQFLDRPKTLTSAHEDYLKAVYLLQSQGKEVTNSALANHLEISPASATNMIKKLAELKLVEYTPYQSISLTPAGEQVALEVLRHHRLLELYLHQELKLPWDQVHAEAERLEHVISEALEDAISLALGNPTVDPHGDPIPSKKGKITEVEGIPLSQAELHVPYRLVRVLMQDEERLRYLGSLGLYINAIVTLLERAPFEGPLLIDVDGTHHALAHEMAQRLLVTVAEAPPAEQSAAQPPEHHLAPPEEQEPANEKGREDV